MAKGKMVDQASDESVRIFLKDTLEHLLAAGHSTHELVEFALGRFGRKIIPYLKEFQEDVRQNKVNILQLTDTAKAAVFGIQVSPEQREQMIREAAYLNAEKRHFSGDGREADWLWAEQQVDELLAKQIGLLEKGQKNIESVSAITMHELTEVNEAVRHWLKAGDAAEKKAG